MTGKRLPILLLHGDAEAGLLADAAPFVEAALPHLSVEVTAAWAQRSSLLAADAPPPPEALRRRGVLPDVDVRELLGRSPRLVLLSLFAELAAPTLRHRSGGEFLAHRTLRAGWTPDQAALVAAECTEVPSPTAAEAAASLQPVIERLQDGGAAVALVTAFRHVNEPIDHRRPDGPPTLRERVRAANLEAARLSMRTGCFVLDLDRAFAQEGGATIGADCFGGGERAREIAQDELLGLVFDALPDDTLPSEVT